ncbi:DUF3298 domain-containing protein [Mesonia ostreae]|uniref:DUF4163 domain-containing protein n=1 Tax=Mesonia ostreae TaxID=861110 RepID=A0ABU2KIL6_9FLAO|nr:DUF3298 domain-containing protein [Mesonia ostreae]MDT0294519.1 DUF4163 domain-containing protein [Mesonia ostreae]
MKKYSFLSLCFIFILSLSCKEDQNQKLDKEDSSEEISSKNLTFSYVTKTISKDSLDTCNINPCPELDIAYLHITDDTDAGKKINQLNEKSLTKIVLTPSDSIPQENMDKSIDKFIEEYAHFKNEFPESHAVYELYIRQEKLFETDSILVLSSIFYNYTGGAHGYGAKLYHTYDKVNTKRIEPRALLKNEKAFKAYAEGMFRKKFNLSEKESLNKNGFFFENDEFKLPENMAITKDSLHMIYNPYEAASYADGDIKFSFPKKDVEAWLNY